MNVNANSVLWTTVDTRNALFASVIPVGLGISHYVSTRPGHHAHNLMKTSAKPDWANCSPAMCGFVDMLALSPLGYATYLVYKNGGGWQYNDVKLALGLYGTSLMFFGACRPLYEHRDYKWLAFNKIVSFATAIAFVTAYYKINQEAAWWSVPYAVASGVGALLFYKLYSINDPKAH